LINVDELLQGRKLLIFDFDGTIADTTPLHAAAFTEVLAPLGIVVDYHSIAGLKTLDAMNRSLAEAQYSLSEPEIEELVKLKQQSVRRMISRELHPLPAVDDFLRRVRPHCRLSMVTSGSRGTVNLSLEQLGYTDWFHPLICADDVHNAKPDPEGFLKVLLHTGISADQALVFEDSEAGFEAARGAGLAYIDAAHLHSKGFL